MRIGDMVRKVVCYMNWHDVLVNEISDAEDRGEDLTELRRQRDAIRENVREDRLLHGPVGTIFAVTYDEGHEDHVELESVDVRWPDGTHETFTRIPEDEDTCSYSVDEQVCVVTPRLYVNVYLWDRECGGPEEGGWYYDTLDPLPEESYYCRTEDEAEEFRLLAEAWCKEENKTRRHPSSVLSEGHYVVHVEAWPGEHQPQRVPHYC